MSKYPDFENNAKTFIEFGVKRKYIGWLRKILLPIYFDNKIPTEEFYFYATTLNNFDKFCEKNYITNKDIWYYSDFESLSAVVKNAEQHDLFKSKIKSNSKNYNSIINDDNFLVAEPFTPLAATKLGAGTKWCISAKETKNYFEDYAARGSRFIFIINKKSGNKDVIEIKGNGDIQSYKSENIKINLLELFSDKPQYIIDKLHDYIGYKFIFNHENTYENIERLLRNPSSMMTIAENSKEKFAFFYNHSDNYQKIKLFSHVLNPSIIPEFLTVSSRFFLDCSNCVLNSNEYNYLLYKALEKYPERYFQFRHDLIVNFLTDMHMTHAYAKSFALILSPDIKDIQIQTMKELDEIFPFYCQINDEKVKSKLFHYMNNSGIHKTDLYSLLYQNLFDSKSDIDFYNAFEAINMLRTHNFDIDSFIEYNFKPTTLQKFFLEFSR